MHVKKQAQTVEESLLCSSWANLDEHNKSAMLVKNVAVYDLPSIS